MFKFTMMVMATVVLCAVVPRAQAFEAGTLNSVVSVLPAWPGHPQGGEDGNPLGGAPEGSAVAVLPGGYLATALHVVARATEIAVRLHDGRRLPAELIGGDAPTDIALLRIDHDLPVIVLGTEPPIGAKACAIGNQFGLGLSVTCGVVSASRLTQVGFNPIEDFLQTDAVVNPGSSGGALVDAEGRLIGMLSAIFTKESDASIGVNFATSVDLLMRIVEDLVAEGKVLRPRAGFRVTNLTAEERALLVGARVVNVPPEGPAAAAGLVVDDVIVATAGRRIAKARDVNTAIQLHRPGDSIAIEILRDGERRELDITLSP